MIIRRAGFDCALATSSKQQDSEAGIDEFSEIIEYRNIREHSLDYFVIGFLSKGLGIKNATQRYVQKDIWKSLKGNIALNVGGDTYCYEKPMKSYALNRYALKNKIPSILWACSIEEQVIDDVMLEDLSRYSLIMPRETITNDVLVAKGLDKKKIVQMVDPAFVLDSQETPLPDIFMNEETIGLNLSPIVSSSNPNKQIIMNNYLDLIVFILKNTKFNVALIPHVYDGDTEDLYSLRKIFDYFTDSRRVNLISKNYNCMQLKYIISRCRMIIAARTHVSIAAYSTCVPSLVIGYSVKSKGLAKDIFGTHQNYVLSSNEIIHTNDIVEYFKWLMINEDGIRNHLRTFIPGYIESAWKAGNYVSKLGVS